MAQFCARFGCFLADARQCARKDAKNKHGADTTIILFFSIIAVLYRLFSSENDTVCCRLKLFLEKYVRKIQDAKNPANLEVSHRYRKNPV